MTGNLILGETHMRWVGVILAVLVLAAVTVAVLPMRWVAARYVPDLEADRVDGSIWGARMANARYQGFPLGDIEAGLTLGELLGGRAVVRFAKEDEAVAGLIVVTPATRGVENVRGAFVLPLFPAPLPPLRLTVADGNVVLDAAGRCQQASGTVTARIDRLPVIGSLPPLEGSARCDGGDLLLPVRAPADHARLDVRVKPGGSWEARLGLPVPAGDVRRTALLAAAGFRLAAGSREGPEQDRRWMEHAVAGTGTEVRASG